ncbi:MAG: PHP domain-containing protein [Planctomycetes bacterium]|nr:PHP domain-containing protein [Planctomycetota bacterium]
MKKDDRRKVDFHCHSSASSGAIGKPPEIARFFKKHGYSAFSLTEHDNFDSLPAARDAAEREAIEYVPGIELSVRSPELEGPGNPIRHVLAFFYQPTPFLADLARRRVEAHKERHRECLRRLKDRGIADITEDDLLAWIPVRFGKDDVWKLPYACHGPIGDLLIQRGVLPEDRSKTVRDLFLEVALPLEDPAAPLMRDILSGLREAGAVLILAHPIRPDMSVDADQERKRLERWLDEYVDGLETFYEKYDVERRQFLRDIVRRRKRPYTGGSDTHTYDLNSNLKWSDAPYACLESLREFRATGRCETFPDIGPVSQAMEKIA